MKNCWEVKGCGRESGGARAAEQGVCPAALQRRLDGVHGGVNAGRACWVVAGTLCGGVVQGDFARKYHNCIQCEFYREVQDQAGATFQFSHLLLKKIDGG